MLYWQIGRDILVSQAEQGWGAKVIDRLAEDLRAAFPDMKGFSPRNLKYMRAFAQSWPDAEFVQEVLAQLPWGHNLILLDRVSGDTILNFWHQRECGDPVLVNSNLLSRKIASLGLVYPLPSHRPCRDSILCHFY